jgi:hypothetical protein
MVQIVMGKKGDPISKINRGKKGWSCGTSGREPA